MDTEKLAKIDSRQIYYCTRISFPLKKKKRKEKKPFDSFASRRENPFQQK